MKFVGLNTFCAPAEIFSVLLDALALGQTVDVLFDARRAECVIPDHLRDGGQIFKYSRCFSPPIPDLDVFKDGIAATLRFGGVPFKTFVPWAATLAIELPNDAGARAIDKIRVVAMSGAAARLAERPRLRAVGADEVPLDDEEEPTPTVSPARWEPRIVKGDA